MSDIIRRLIPRRGMPSRGLPATNPAQAGFFRSLANDPGVNDAVRAMRQADLDRHFGRPDETFKNFELPMPEVDQFARADPGTFGPAVQRMMRNAEYEQAVGDLTAGDVVEMLARNDRINTLARVNANRRGGETAELFNVAQQSIQDAAERARRSRQASAYAASMADNIGLGALGVGAAATIPAALSRFTESGDPEEVVPVERELDPAPEDVVPPRPSDYWAMDQELPVFRGDDGSVYTPPAASVTDDNIDALEGIPLHVPPEEEAVVAAMLASVAPPENGMPAIEEMLPFDTATDADLKEMMNGGRDTYLGKPRLPAVYGRRELMSDRQMEQMDLLTVRGIDPTRALKLVRGEISPTRAEMKLLMTRPYE